MGNVAIFKGKLVKFLAKAGILIPKRATTDRSLTPEQGETAFNTTVNKLEVYNGSSWVQLDAGGGTTGTLIHPTTNSTFEFGAQDNIPVGETYTGWGNTAIGVDAGDSLSSGEFNTLYGYAAGTTLTQGFRNTFVGFSSGQNASGNVTLSGAFNNNTAVGMRALGSLISGQSNVAIGYSTLYGSITSGNNNTVISSQQSDLPSGISGIVVIGRDSTASHTSTTTGNARATQDNDFVLGTSLHNYKLPGKVITSVTLAAQNEIRFADADSSNYVGFKAQTTVTSNEIYELPTATGTVGQVLGISSIPATGTTRLAWTTPASGTVSGSNISGPIYSRSSGQATKIYGKSASNALANRAVNTWTARTASAFNQWTSVCWSPELSLFCAVAYSGTNDRVMTSPDGITWTSRLSAADNEWNSICWSPELGLFVAVAVSSATSTNKVMTSPDGSVWTLRTPSNNVHEWQSVCWSPELGIFVAVAGNGFTTGNRAMWSNNGITWTAATTPADNAWRSVCWSSELGLFVAVASSGIGDRVMTSTNGTTWTIRSSAADHEWRCVTWSPDLGMFCALPYGGTSYMTSVDGITWTSRTASAISVASLWTSITWSKELGLFCGIQDQLTNGIITSPDGLVWTTRNAVSDAQWQSICWASEKGIFVGVGTPGTGALVQTSKYVGVRGITSY
jgi:hypothetical protein